MIIKVDIENELYQKIEDLVRNGKYQDPYQFIRIALTNQVQEELAEVQFSERKQIPTSVSLSQIIKKSIDDIKTTLSETPLEESQISFPTENLIWSFYNRFFPVKLVIRHLATLISPKNIWVDLNQMKDSSYAFAEEWSFKLKRFEEENEMVRNEKISTGLPTPMSELSKARGFQRKKVETKIFSSKVRFTEQFVGRLTKKEPPYEFKGACFEMTLMGIKIEEKKCYVTLTEKGREFALLMNPILDHDKYDDAFYDEEVEFIFNKILPSFKLENMIVKRILDELHQKELTSEDIDCIFEEEKIRYYKINKPTKKEEKEKFEKEIERERVATMGRLSELRKVKWNIDNYGKSRYELKTH